MVLTQVWSGGSRFNCCTLWNTWKCFRLSIVTWSLRTLCSRRTISQVSRWSTLEVVPFKTSACIHTYSLGSIERLRLCLGFLTTALLTCGPSAAFALNCSSGTLSSLASQSRTRCAESSRWLDCRSLTCFRFQRESKSFSSSLESLLCLKIQGANCEESGGSRSKLWSAQTTQTS